MAEVFAGWLVGFALSIVAAPTGAIALVRSNRAPGLAQRWAPEGTNVVALSVVVHFAAVLVLTAVGIVLGLALGGIEDRRPDSGLGSPTLAYTMVVVALTAVLIIPTLILPAVRRWAIGAAVVFAAMFGWAMPWLAVAGS
jgi:hypothetical protein